MNEMKIGFEMRKIRLALEDISPMRQIKDLHKGVLRYKKILASIKEVGLVEPLVVYPQKDAPGKYLLKNGHLRYVALKELGQPTCRFTNASRHRQKFHHRSICQHAVQSKNGWGRCVTAKPVTVLAPGGTNFWRF